MYYDEAVKLLKKKPIGSIAKRTCWENAHIIYDRFMNEFTFVRRYDIDNNIMSTCFRYYPSHSDTLYDDWIVE